MSDAEKLAHAQQVKSEGAELFKEKEWEAARTFSCWRSTSTSKT